MDSSPEDMAEGLAIVRVLAAVLERLVAANESQTAHQHTMVLTKFHAMKAPGISVEQYLERIIKYASCSNECFILSLIYIDRLIQRNNFVLSELNVHRVVITSVLLAAKFYDDSYYNNSYYARVGGVLVSEMNGLEVDFLFRINFSLHFTPEEFEQYRRELLAHAVQKGPPPAQVSPEMHGIDPTATFQDELTCGPSISTHHPHEASMMDGCMIIEDDHTYEDDDDDDDDLVRWHLYNIEPNPVAMMATTVDPLFGIMPHYGIQPQYGIKDCLPHSPSTAFEQRPRLTGMLGAGL